MAGIVVVLAGLAWSWLAAGRLSTSLILPRTGDFLSPHFVTILPPNNHGRIGMHSVAKTFLSTVAWS